MWDSLEQPQQQQPQPRLGVVTIHDACPAFSKKIFESADELERLNIKFPKSEGVPHEIINPMLLKECHAKE